MTRTVEVETLEPRRLFAGVTLLATGRLGGTNGWIESMADAMTSQLGGAAQVPRYVLSINEDTNTEDLVPSITHVDGTGTPQTSSSGEIIVVIDYYNISANPIYPSTYIGSVIANYLMDTPVDGILLASLPIHEVGVSRGAAIMDGISQTLGQSGIWVDQETYLDPDPIAAQGDPASTIFDNVEFVDDYWRNDGSQSQENDGHPVDGAYNLNVAWLDTDDAGYSTPHLAPAGYYIGTIDQTATYSGEGPIYSDWYGDTPTMPARNATGFIYTSIIGAARPLSGVWAASGGAGTRTAAGEEGTQWGDMTDLAVTSGGSVASGNSIGLTYLREDRDSADTITFYLDTDRNPYDGAFAATLATRNVTEADAPTRGGGTLSTAGVAPGTYWLCAQITDAQGNTRYAYESVTTPLTVTASVKNTPPPPVTPPPVIEPATITGTYFNDLNGNGTQDPSEPGLAGLLVYVDLAGTGGYEASDPSATTDSGGNYTIDGLTPGTPLTVLAVVPAGMRETTEPSDPVTLASGQTLGDLDFGATQSAMISGAVALKNIPSTPAETSPSGFEVILTQHLKHQKIERFRTVTDADGSFSFDDLQPGATDTVAIVKRQGFKLAPHARSSYAVSVGDGQAVNSLIFSEVPIVRRAQAIR